MKLHLQCGWGMMEICRNLIDKWGGGAAILSPRDQEHNQLVRLASDILKLPGGAVYLDPQFYLPHSEHQRLCSHEYWPESYSTGIFWNGPQLDELLKKLFDLNATLQASSIILPGLLAKEINDDWIHTERAIFERAKVLHKNESIIPTIALSEDALRSEEQITLLLEEISEWRASAYYLVCEHPNGDYLVKDPNWLANALDLTAGMKLSGAKVILGYSNHQMLIAASSKVDAICSGTWMNVRSFPPGKFDTAEDEIKQKTTWYYCPQSMSEYKIPFLDIARRQGVLNTMLPASNAYVGNLFSGAQPTTVGFTEPEAFRHYLHSLREQASKACGPDFDQTVNNHEALLANAESTLHGLRQAGIVGQQRDFAEIIDVNRAALNLLKATRGPMLRRMWKQL